MGHEEGLVTLQVQVEVALIKALVDLDLSKDRLNTGESKKAAVPV